MKLLVMGNVTIDTVSVVEELPRDLIAPPVLSQNTYIGGRGANVAVIASRLGATVELASFVGGDLPSNYLAHLQAAGVGLTFLRVFPSAKTARFHEFRTRQFDSTGFLEPFKETDNLGVDDLALTFDGIYVTPFDSNLHLNELSPILVHHRNVFLSLGEELRGIDSRLIETSLGVPRYLLLNEEELTLLLSKLGVDSPSDLLKRFPRLEGVVTTVGPKGALLFSRDGTSSVRPVPCEPRTVLGAGDAAAAGFMFAVLNGASAVEGARFGQVVASMAIEHDYVQSFSADWSIIESRYKAAYGELLKFTTVL